MPESKNDNPPSTNVYAVYAAESEVQAYAMAGYHQLLSRPEQLSARGAALV